MGKVTVVEWRLWTSREPGSSVDPAKKALGRVCEVRHEQFDAASIDVVRAGHVVALLDVWHLIGKALSVKGFLRVVRLVLDHVVGH